MSDGVFMQEQVSDLGMISYCRRLVMDVLGGCRTLKDINVTVDTKVSSDGLVSTMTISAKRRIEEEMPDEETLPLPLGGGNGEGRL